MLSLEVALSSWQGSFIFERTFQLYFYGQTTKTTESASLKMEQRHWRHPSHGLLQNVWHWLIHLPFLKKMHHFLFQWSRTHTGVFWPLLHPQKNKTNELPPHQWLSFTMGIKMAACHLIPYLVQCSKSGGLRPQAEYLQSTNILLGYTASLVDPKGWKLRPCPFLKMLVSRKEKNTIWGYSCSAKKVSRLVIKKGVGAGRRPHFPRFWEGKAGTIQLPCAIL